MAAQMFASIWKAGDKTDGTVEIVEGQSVLDWIVKVHIR